MYSQNKHPLEATVSFLFFEGRSYYFDKTGNTGACFSLTGPKRKKKRIHNTLLQRKPDGQQAAIQPPVIDGYHKYQLTDVYSLGTPLAWINGFIDGVKVI